MDDKKLSKHLGIRLAPEDLAEVRRLAALDQRKPSEWARLKILKAIGRG